MIRPNTIHTYAMSITHEHYPLVWPLDNIDFIVANSIIFDQQTNFHYYIRKSVNLGNNVRRREESLCVRSLLFEGWVLYYDTNTNTTRYLTIHVCNVTQRGWGGMSNIWNRIFANRAKSLHSNLLSMLLVHVDLNDDNGVLETGQINKARQQEKMTYSFNSLFMTQKTSGPENHSLKRLIYTSRFHPERIDSDTLGQIETISIRNNSALNITGVLMCSNALIYQVLEGETAAIDEIYEKILHDPRHYDIQCVAEEYNLTEEDRQYPNWSMRVVNLQEYHSYFGKIMSQFLKKSYSVFELDTACLF
jgi:hypothetical protein